MNDTRRAVLEALADGPVTGPALADRLGVSRNAVWKHVEALRDAGFEVASGDDGYALAGTPEYGGPAVEYGLDAPFEVEYHDAVGSTNDRARELAAEGAADVAVLADEQTGGRGRLDREWSAPPGGVYLSAVLRPDLPPAHAPALTLAAAVATTDAAREAGVPAEIKWPNDVLVSEANESTSEPRSDDVLVPVDSDGDVTPGDEATDRGGRKLAGILTEMEGEADRVSWVVVGIGVNANIPADDLPAGATSIEGEVGGIDRRAFVQRLLERFDELRADPEAAVEAWRERAATLGERVRVETPNREIVGEAVDVAFPGALVVETDDGERARIHAGDCEHLRPA
ncbi:MULTISPECIES: biotin--[acetyl-CoA-carboxylase] ligase [Halorussus]|uniref:biotin--[acetyl-CoA-carboxylase] ligase n=1 Tax=Halorussus TaxID=1070314 RepID=UPI000E210A0F|nr:MULTISPECIES: biotin--[acetyl-CoA-carboxylase] ligase [Halorussus]NHN59330.1 biotin--[acetyl-CoA-carboxylase] ligase [Halorussus sp. JP-T4]